MTKAMTATQLKAGRNLLGWSQAELALNAGLSQMSVARLETIGPRYLEQSIAVQRVLAEAGVQFSEGNARITKKLSDEQLLLASEAEDDDEHSD